MSSIGESESADALWRKDAVALAAMIRDRAVSCREVTQSCLARMDTVNGWVNAVVRRFDDEAMAAADAADAKLRRGDSIGALHGVPVTIKVNTDQKGHPTDGGVVAYRDLIAETDSPVVENFKAAGAVIIGRTNTPCYSMRWETQNDLHGATRNPWHPRITPGGSSGGAAAAVAAGFGPIAHGNDIAGSVRYPAYCCGVAGLRPSYGRVPAHNASSKAPMSISSQLMAVQGPLARSVRDLRVTLEVLARPSIRDFRHVTPASFSPFAAPLRVALVPEPDDAIVHPAVAEAVRAAGLALKAAGCIVEEVAPPDLEGVASLWAKLAMADVMASLQLLVDDNGDYGIRKAVGFWNDVLPKFTASDTLVALAERAEALRNWQFFLARYPVVVMPVSYEPPFATGFDITDVATTRRVMAAQSPQFAIPVLGLPAVSVPTGIVDGVPMGVQIVAGRFREDMCLDAAEIIEAACGVFTPIDPRMD